MSIESLGLITEDDMLKNCNSLVPKDVDEINGVMAAGAAAGGGAGAAGGAAAGAAAK